jgi:hypothetical protein
VRTLHFSHACYMPRTSHSPCSSVGIALDNGPDDRGSRVRFSAGAGNFSLHHRVQNGSGAHPASYPMGTGALSLGIKRQGREADHSPPSSAEVEGWVKLYLHSPNTPSWRGAQLKHRDNFTFTFNNIWWSVQVMKLLKRPRMINQLISGSHKHIN